MVARGNYGANFRKQGGMIRPKQYTVNGQQPKKGYRGARKTHILILGVIITMVAVWMVTWLRLLPSKHVATEPTAAHGTLRSTANVVQTSDSENNDDDDDQDDDDDDDSPQQDAQDHIGNENDAQESEEDGEEPDDQEDENNVVESNDENSDDFEEEEGEKHEVNDQQVVFGSANSASITSKLPPLHELDTKVTLQDYFTNMGKKAVNIDPSGSYKFVLCKLTDKESKSTLVVQGCPHYQGSKCKHPDAARIVKKGVEHSGIELNVVGGGRITRHHLRSSKKAGLISIFGYSKTYAKQIGRCNDCNAKACALIHAAYPDYLVRWSNQGYSEKDEREITDWVKCSEEA